MERAHSRPVPSLREGQMRKHRVNHWKSGILAGVLGDRSASTFDFRPYLNSFYSTLSVAFFFLFGIT